MEAAGSRDRFLRRGAAGRAAHRFQQSQNLLFVQFIPAPRMQAPPQGHRPEPHPDQPADGDALRFPKPAHLAVAAFPQNHVIPVVGSFAACLPDLVETRQSILQQHPLPQPLQHLRRNLAQHPRRVFPFDLGRRVHQAVGQFAVVGHQEQALGVEIEPTDRDPAAIAQRGQVLEDRGPAFRIVAAGYLADRLVIGQHSPPLPERAHLD